MVEENTIVDDEYGAAKWYAENKEAYMAEYNSVMIKCGAVWARLTGSPEMAVDDMALLKDKPFRAAIKGLVEIAELLWPIIGSDWGNPTEYQHFAATEWELSRTQTFDPDLIYAIERVTHLHDTIHEWLRRFDDIADWMRDVMQEAYNGSFSDD